MDDKNSFRWSPLHFGSALVVLAADWLIYAVNIASLGAQFLAVDLAGAVAALLGVAMIESEVAHVRPQHAWLKGLGCALVVAYPLPSLGSALALVALLWDGVARYRRRHAA